MGCNNNQLHLVGKSFGRLTVISEAGRNARQNVLWLCKCDCSNETTVAGTLLVAGAVQSCGCLHSERVIARNRNAALPEGQAAFNQLYARYIRIAQKRDLTFELTKEDFSFLTKMNCHYCGGVPGQVTKTTTGSYYTYNGIDRLDSDRGYDMKNVVPCCKICNTMKNKMSVSDFLEHIEKIYLRSK